MVMHSPWWINEHWGRAFDLVSLVPDGFASTPPLGQGSVLMRKRDCELDPATLERITPGDTRETLALAHNVSHLQCECAGLRRDSAEVDGQLKSSLEQNRELEAQILDLTRRLITIEESRSWSMTRPLRAVAREIRALRARTSSRRATTDQVTQRSADQGGRHPG